MQTSAFTVGPLRGMDQRWKPSPDTGLRVRDLGHALTGLQRRPDRDVAPSPHSLGEGPHGRGLPGLSSGVQHEVELLLHPRLEVGEARLGRQRVVPLGVARAGDVERPGHAEA